MISNRNEETASSKKGGFPGLMIVGAVLVVSLLIAGLFLPPISLGQRLGLGGADESAETVDVEGAAGAVEAGVEGLSLRLEDGPAEVEVSAITPTDFAADEEMAAMAAALPENGELMGHVYLVRYEGSAPRGSLTMTLPEGTAPADVDLYGWDGSSWLFIPADGEGQLVSPAVSLPEAVVLVRPGTVTEVAVGAEVLPTQELPAAVLPYLTEISAGTLTLNEDGTLAGETADVATGGYSQFVRATNTGVIVDSATLATVLGDPQLLAQHKDALIAATQDFAALNLDYQGVPVGQRERFSSFVAELAEALHAQDKLLVVTLAAPAVASSGERDPMGQDWAAIGQAADVVYLQMPLNPGVYAADGSSQALVEWAVGQVERSKLSLLFSANAVDAVGSTFRELPNDLALANFGELSLMQGGEEVAPGTAIEVGLAGTASPLEWDNSSMMYRYSYEQAGQDHLVWLNNEAAVSQRLSLAAPLNLRGVALRGLANVVEGKGYAQALESYVNTAAAPEPAGAAIVWTVEDEAESVVASSSGEALSYLWEDTDEPGKYTINAVFAQGDAVAKLGTVNVEIEDPGEAEEPVRASGETQEETEPAPTTAAASAATPAAAAATPAPQVDPGNADAALSIALNFRTGPSTRYPATEVLPVGTQVSLIGRNEDSSWLQVRLVQDTSKEGWLFANYLEINSNVSIPSLAVVEVEPPPVADTSGGSTGSTGTAGSPPPPVAGGGGFGGFGLGGQVNGFPQRPDAMQQAGMSWAKVQAHAGQDMSGTISGIHGLGFKVLISVIGDKSQVMNDGYQREYGSYVGQLAAQGADAIEIWNEANLDREWPRDQIDPAAYTNLLAYSFNAIKSANGGTLVISGAPAPTGAEAAFPGQVMNDNNWLRGVVNAGGLNYMDCVGIHYNEGTTSPYAWEGSAQGDNYYTRYYGGMVNTYWNITGGSRPLCFTEMGYLSPEGYGGLPGNFAWASGTTVAQQAQWLGEAVSMARSSGQVRLLIVFNVDFTQWLPTDPQAGYAIVRPGGGCPACASMGAAMGG